MTKLANIKTILGRFLSASILCFVNACLWVLLFFSSIFLVCLHFNIQLDLPESLAIRLKEELKRESLELNSDSIKLDLRGNIILENPKVRFVGTASNFLTAKSLSFGLSLGDILSSKVDLDYLYIEDAFLSPLNVDESDMALVSNLSLRVYRRGDIYNIKALRLRLGELGISIKGTFDRRFLAKFKDEPKQVNDEKEDKGAGEASRRDDASSLDIYTVFDKITSSIEDIKTYANKLNVPNFALDFDITKSKIKALRALFVAKDIGLDFKEKHLALGEIQVAFDLVKNGQIAILAKAKNVDFNKEYKARCLNLSGDFNYAKNLKNFALKRFSLDDLSLSLLDFQVLGENIDYISLAAQNLSLTKAPKTLDFYAKKGDSQISAAAKLLANRIDLDFDFFENPELFLEIPALAFLQKTKVIPLLAFDEAISLKGDASFFFEENLGKWELANLNFDNFKSFYDIEAKAFLYGKKVTFSNKFVEEAYGLVDFKLSTGDIFIRDIYLLSSEKWALNGLFYQSISNLDYLFEVDGAFEPSCLNNVMAPWWTFVFEKFDLLDFPKASVFVKGRWGEPEFTWAYAKVAVSKAKYNGYAFEDISLCVNVNPAIICAYDVELKGGDGSANACLAWVYDPSAGLEKYIYRNIAASVDMNFEGIKALGGEDVEDIVALISFDNNIALNFDLYDINPRRDPNFEQKITFDFDAKKAIKVSYFNFDSISGKGNAKGQNFFIKDAKASFIDGELKGDFSLEKIEGKNFFKTSLDAKGLNQGKLIELIESIAKEDEEQKPKSESIYLGKVDSTLTAEGFLLDFDSYKAQATLLVENKELQKVSIFGGISRVLETFNIPLTTLEFTTFDGNFSLENGKIFFPKLEIKSDTSVIFGKAIYTAMTDALSARMYFNWQTASTIPILGHIADFMFDPILDSILIVVSNTFTNPSFSLRVRPFNIFNSSETMIDNIDADSL